ncbi:hypothetical protein B566_EDAN019132, partial [Ephemera danica]
MTLGKNENLTTLVRRGDIEAVKVLLSQGISPDSNDCGVSPLTRAIIGNHIEIVKLLLEAGADVNFQNDGNVSPLMTAVVEIHTFSDNNEPVPPKRKLAKVYQTEEIRSEASKVVNCDQLEEQPYEKIVPLKSRILVEETASIPSEEGSVNTGQTNQITQLKAEIFKAFDSKTSEKIMENCTFTELETNKLGIKRHPAPIEEVSKVMQAQSNCLKWDRFKKELLNYFPEKTGDHILNAWFDKLR